MDTHEPLSDREVALILTVLKLLGKPTKPHQVQLDFLNSAREVEQARRHAGYPLPVE